MNTFKRRSDAAIAATRSTLHDLKSQAPGGLRDYVIDLALAAEDPLNFWGNSCDVAFVVTNLMSIEAEALNSLHQRYMDEIEAIKDQCLSSPHGVVTYETDFLTRFAIEHTAFKLRQCLQEQAGEP